MTRKHPAACRVILTHLRQLTHDRSMATTQSMATASVPVIRRRWRLKISMEEAGLTSASMAEELGVSRATVTRWFADDDMLIRPAYLKAWAARTEVPYEWLTGAPVTDPTDPALASQPTVTEGEFTRGSDLSGPRDRRRELVSVCSSDWVTLLPGDVRSAAA